MGELFDLSDAPYRESRVPEGTTDEAAVAARKSLQAILDQHRAAPAGGNKKAGKAAKKKARKQQ